MNDAAIDLSNRPMAIIRPSKGQVIFWIALLVLQATLLALGVSTGDGVRWTQVFNVLLPIGFLALARTRRTTVGPDGVTYRELWTTREISWEDAESVDVPPRRGWLMATTVRGSGRWQRVALSQPWSTVEGPDGEVLGLAYARAHDVPIGAAEGSARRGYLVALLIVMALAIPIGLWLGAR